MCDLDLKIDERKWFMQVDKRQKTMAGCDLLFIKRFCLLLS